MQVLNFPSPYRQGEAPYDIFKDRMAAITTIVQGIKGRILNKYNKGLLDTTIDQLNKSLTQDQATETINLLNADPGEDIYPGGIEEMAGKFVDTFNVMGKLAQKESTMGGMRSMQGIPPTQGMPPTSEVMLPKGDKAQLLNAIQNMPEGQMDFAPILNYMKEHRPSMMGTFSPMEEWVMNQALGQESPKEKLSKDLALAKSYSDYFTGTEKPSSELEHWLQEHPGEGVEQYWEAKKEPETPAQILKDVTDYLDSIYKTGNAELFNEEAKKLGIPTTFDTYGQKYEKPSLMANQYFKTADEVIKNSDKIPGYRIDPTLDKDKGWYANYTAEPKPTGGLTTPTYSTAESIEKGFMEKVENVQDFGSELKRLQGLGIDTKTFETTEYFAGLMEKKYKEVKEYVKYAFDKVKNWDSLSEKEQAGEDYTYEQYRELYKKYWEQANNYDQQYFNVTGKHLLTGE